MAEAVAADGARVVPDDGRIALVLRGDLLVDVLVVLLDPNLGRRAVPVPVLVLGLFLVARDQLCEHPGERVDLVTPELGAGGEARGMVGEDALEPEHERVLDLPLVGGRLPACIHLGECGIERASSRAAFGEGLGGVLARVEEDLACPRSRSEGGRRQGVRSLRRYGRMAYRFLHGGSRDLLRRTQECVRERVSRQLLE